MLSLLDSIRRNVALVSCIRGARATLLLDLHTPDEELVDSRTAHLRFDIPLLAERLVGATIGWREIQ
jgi:hypothetical protein